MPAGAGGEKEKWNEELASKHAGAGGEVKPDGEHVGPRGERRGASDDNYTSRLTTITFP